MALIEEPSSGCYMHPGLCTMDGSSARLKKGPCHDQLNDLMDHAVMITCNGKGARGRPSGVQR